MRNRKFLAVIICFLLIFSTACKKEGSAPITEGYTYQKQSADKLYFYSSDSSLNLFLNDFYQRHSRSEEETAINAMQLGDGGTGWKSWEAMSLVWFDSTSTNFRQDSFSVLKQWIYSAPVDEYGYCWSAMAGLEQVDRAPGNQTFGMGWPFPNYDGSGYYDWEFNGYVADDTEGWSVETDGNLKLSRIGDGLWSNKIENSSHITFSYDLGEFGMQTSENPFLEMDIRWCVDGLFEQNDVDDVYVSWKVKGSDEWYTAKQSEYTARAVPITANYANHIYMPLYLHKNWGVDNEITELKVSLKAKPGKTINGEVNLNCIRANYDSRQIDNGFNLIDATKLYYEFTGDKKVLEDALARCRKIIMFMIYNMGGESGLIDLSNFVGHNGGVIADGVSQTIASSYWDVISLSPKSVYAQVLYYQSLQDVAFLEEYAEKEGLSVEKPSIKLFDGERITYDLTKEDLKVLAKKVAYKVQQPVNKSAQTGYFDTEKGRFIEGFNLHGNVVDYGSTIFNNMVVSAGMATKYQSERVISWISGERVIQSDNAKGFVGNANEYLNFGIYDYEFAPRTTTVKNAEQYTTGHFSEAGKTFGASCQDGGAILFTSYYDLMARIKTRGVEDAYARLKQIRDWYLKVYNYSSKNGYGGAQFYRGYYNSEVGIPLQGMGVAGCLGLDSEFLENAIVYSIIPFGLFNLKSEGVKNLSVEPNLPSELSFLRMENLMYNGVRYDLEAGQDYVILESVRGNTDGMKCTLRIKTTSQSPKVYCNGKELSASQYTVSNGVVTITVDFRAQKIQVK